MHLLRPARVLDEWAIARPRRLRPRSLGCIARGVNFVYLADEICITSAD